jgi:hypothetical protein
MEPMVEGYVLEIILGLIALGVVLVLYFIPAIIAWQRRHRQRVAILVVNIFFGWTFVGWIIAFVWALTRR